MIFQGKLMGGRFSSHGRFKIRWGRFLLHDRFRNMRLDVDHMSYEVSSFLSSSN